MRRFAPAPWAMGVLASAGLLVALVALDAPMELRLPASLWFLLVCPGMAWAPLLGLRPPPAVLALGVGLSVAIDVLAITALLYAGAGISAWSMLAVLAPLCVVGCLLQQLRRAEGVSPAP